MIRRYGRFCIAADMVRNATPELTRIMGSCAIFRAEYMMVSNRVEYVAYSFRFREIEEGEIAPLYEWFFSNCGDMWCEEVK